MECSCLLILIIIVYLLGFVISMYTLLRNNPQPSEEEMETSFQGKALLDNVAKIL